jgi:hypothetical protein
MDGIVSGNKRVLPSINISGNHLLYPRKLIGLQFIMEYVEILAWKESNNITSLSIVAFWVVTLCCFQKTTVDTFTPLRTSNLR